MQAACARRKKLVQTLRRCALGHGVERCSPHAFQCYSFLRYLFLPVFPCGESFPWLWIAFSSWFPMVVVPLGAISWYFSGASYMLIACAPVWWTWIRKRLAIRYPVASSPDDCQQIVLWSFCGEHKGLLRLGWSSPQWYLLKEALSRLHVSVLCWDPLRFAWSEPQRHLSRQAWSRSQIFENMCFALRSNEVGLRWTSTVFIKGDPKPFAWFCAVEVWSVFGFYNIKRLKSGRTSTVHDVAF